jgi:acyl carrier protein
MVTGPKAGWGALSGLEFARSARDRDRHPLPLLSVRLFALAAGRNRNRANRDYKRVAAMSDIGERVKKIVVEHLGVEADKVTENASFIDDLGADSLDTVELVMAFEEEFGCEIPDDAAETILTVGDAVKFLEKNAKS